MILITVDVFTLQHPSSVLILAHFSRRAFSFTRFAQSENLELATLTVFCFMKAPGNKVASSDDFRLALLVAETMRGKICIRITDHN